MTDEGRDVNGSRYTNACACGWTIEGGLDEVVDATIDHGRRIHNMEATRDQVVAALATREPIAEASAE
jgi:predicted small metal-binding protein